MDLKQIILTAILDEPGRPFDALAAQFDLSSYRLSRVLRHIERDLVDGVVMHQSGRGVWIVSIDASRCTGLDWRGAVQGGYSQCGKPGLFPDGRCYEHSEYEALELVAFQRRLTYLCGPAEPSHRTLIQLSLTEIEELLTVLGPISPETLKDERTKAKLLEMLSAARAALRWRDMMRRRQRGFGRVPPGYEERHRQSSINSFEYSLKQHFRVLEVALDATREEVLKAWRKMARRYHPDTPEGDEEMMKAVNLAKEKIFRMRRWD